MSAYFPIVIGNTGLRHEVEGLFDGNHPELVRNRMEELDFANMAKGQRATFGTEIEFQFIADPGSGTLDDCLDADKLYESVVTELQGNITSSEVFSKGYVVPPEARLGSVMLNAEHKASIDGQSDDLIEIRTTPQGSLEAIELYWNVVSAIGTVAAENGLMGQILSTHISAAALVDGPFGERFLGFFNGHEQGQNFIAATQHNLNALNPYQIDAGLEEGITVLQAFPTKDASTAVHGTRLEFRHPAVGVVDPRIDILATLHGLELSINETVPSAANKNLKSGAFMTLVGPYTSFEYMKTIEDNTLLDPKTNRLVIPARLQSSSWNKDIEELYDVFIECATDGEEAKFAADNAEVFRDIIARARYKRNKIFFQPPHKHVENLNDMFSGFYFDQIGAPSYTLPFVRYESPATHRASRADSIRSTAVRRVIGGAKRAVIDAGESIERRNALVDNHMIVLGDD